MPPAIDATRWVRPDWSVLRVTGADAGSFLHNLSTNDIKGLAVGAACETLFTNVKAKVVAHAVVCRHSEDVFDVVVTSRRTTELAEHLDKYLIREEVTIVDRPDPALVLTWGGNEPTETGVFALPALGAGASLSFDAVGEGEAMSQAEFDALRVECRFPLDVVDVDDRNLPQELNRDAALINFNKGCYLGQETVARIDALGRVNQLLVALRLEEGATSAAGESLTAGDATAGRLTTIARNREGRSVALAYVRRDHAAPGTKLSTPGGAIAVVQAAPS